MAMAATTVTAILKPAFAQIEKLVNGDPDFRATVSRVTATFGIASEHSDLVIATIECGTLKLSTHGEPSFTLCARSSDWQLLFQNPPPRFYQSYWSILRTFSSVSTSVRIAGSHVLFARHARLWRIFLDRTRDTLNNTLPAQSARLAPMLEPSGLRGAYATVTHPSWGHCTIYHETAGHGPQPLLLLHTAGADARQNHAVMSHPALQAICTIYTFDLPGHGRSYPAECIPPGAYALTEDDYVACIALMLQHLNLTSALPRHRPIVCGASMGGHACLALAIRARELRLGGVICLEGCEHMPFTQPAYETGAPGEVDEGTLNAERIYSMIGPAAPEAYKRLIWWGYAAQCPGTFGGDLRFYFGGWDGRGRIQGIDTGECPVWMFTGEYDYSCTAERSEETAGKIPGARFEMLEGMGHFPLSEDPERFVPVLVRAVEGIVAQRREEL